MNAAAASPKEGDSILNYAAKQRGDFSIAALRYLPVRVSVCVCGRKNSSAESLSKGVPAETRAIYTHCGTIEIDHVHDRRATETKERRKWTFRARFIMRGFR